MMKKAWLLVTVLIIGALALLSTQAIASPQSIEAKKTPKAEKTPKPKNVPGAVAAQKAEEKAFRNEEKVRVRHENYIGILNAVDAGSVTIMLRDESMVTIMLSEDTRLLIPTRKDVMLEDFEIGRRVIVQALRAEDDTLTARSVILIPGKPVKLMRVGIVTMYTPGEQITIMAMDEMEYTYLLTEDTVILPMERADMLDLGAKVTIIAPRDVTKIVQTALKIVVHPMDEMEP
jgi:hypothetical protein